MTMLNLMQIQLPQMPIWLLCKIGENHLSVLKKLHTV
jgi:hypothetical protein